MKLAPRSNLKIKAAFAFALLALLSVGGVAYQDRQASVESRVWVDHTYEVIESLRGLMATLEGVESSYRGFAWTGQESYLGAYQTGVVLFGRKLAEVRGLTADNANQQRLIPQLAALSDLKIQRAEVLIGIRRSGGLPAVLESVVNTPDEELMQRFRAIVVGMQSSESRLLAARSAEADGHRDQTNTTLILGSVVSLGVAAFASWSVLRDNTGRALEQQALRESEERYHMLLDGLQDYAIFVLDPKGRVSGWNAGAVRITGYTSEQITGRDFSCFFPQDQVEQGRPAKVLKIAAEKGRYEEQGLRVRRDGSKFMATVTLTALRDPEGKLRGFSDISRDLSESKESEARYRGLLEAAPDAMVVVDQSGDIVLLNVQAEKQFGYRRDELVGQPVKNIIPEGFAERLIADGTRSAAEALAQQIGTGIELTGRRKDGSGFPIEIMLSPLESAEGILVTAAIRDISVRKAAEQQLAQMEGRYRGLLEAAPDAMVVVNQSGEIVLLNKQAEKQFGYRRDALVGQAVKNIIPEGFAERLIADALRSTEDALAQQIGAGIELVGRRKNGSAFPIEIMLSPLESTEGILVTAAIRDITTRKNEQMQLRRAMEMLQQIIESSPVAIVNLDSDSRIVTWNRRAEEIFGYSAREAIGHPYADLVGTSDADSLGELREVLTGRMVRSVEIERKRKDGSTVVLSVAAAALTDHGKSPVGIIALFEDITQAKATRSQLQHVQKMEAVGQLSGGIAHDFNNLLSVIIGNLDSLLIRLKSDKERDIAKNALKGALRCAELTRQMLAFARRQELDPVEIDAGTMLRNLSEMLERMLGEMVKVETSTTADLWPCVADEDQVESALLNLAVNARDAMPDGGTLTIDASNARLEASYAARNSEVLAGDYVKFAVSDTGTGMSPELRARAMEPFFTTKDPGKGTGLGLSMVHGFAKQSGGHVKIYSELGFGTTVNLFLPRAQSAQAASADREESTATPSQGNETILVVDDNIEVRATACMQLTELGYRVIEAGDGKSALEILGNASTIDLVFSDVVMPGGMTGFDLARVVYRDHPEIKVLLVTGFAGAVLRQHVEVGETMPMLRKPYRRDELAARIRQVLDAKPILAEPVLTAMSGGVR